ncbi:nudix hydrolase 3 [Capsaspora owczarzaki ATCC 30864]|uniref:Nudix hydrolase 3 n=1 Tax=Capsaspora owczarzaki (strain ATCC 30864) TaxID=595528 RepID=A0A0D2UQM2_CAPO3|nr:nudix hydrolase 3 [Capsaspora owczarzaki ATCC 30864]KJE97316.1 nudix hydrolase 3 [Capsaspora owczarzaki ATCC 30864]|eukprot:XP_004343618.2 nudix hydrolase 3 [Capsaspora owczarzaki ATCC 30864]
MLQRAQSVVLATTATAAARAWCTCTVPAMRSTLRAAGPRASVSCKPLEHLQRRFLFTARPGGASTESPSPPTSDGATLAPASTGLSAAAGAASTAASTAAAVAGSALLDHSPQTAAAPPTPPLVVSVPGVQRPVHCEPVAADETRIPTAHLLGAPERARMVAALKSLKRRHLSRQRSAAVLVPLCTVNGVPSVLFTVRASSLSSHSGEVSFPGGIRDPTDASIEETALRESFEELAIPKDQIDILGCFHDTLDKSRTISVTPVIGVLKDGFQLSDMRLSPGEVASAFTLPIDQIINPAVRQFAIMDKQSGYRMPVYQGGPAAVWGLTAFIVECALAMVVVPASVDDTTSPAVRDAVERYRRVTETNMTERAARFVQSLSKKP